MTTKRIMVKSMLMSIITVIICFGFTACNDNNDDPSGHHDAPTIYESYGLTYHNFDHADDVLILDDDTTEIAIKKSLADKLGITSFVNHPIGIWDAPSHLAYGRKALEERLEGDTYILKVTKVTIAELIGDNNVERLKGLDIIKVNDGEFSVTKLGKKFVDVFSTN